MSLYLKILNGPLVGTSVKLKGGLTIGRAKADLILKDTKVSSTHARIDEVSTDTFTIVDLDSTNGIEVSGKKQKKLPLVRGTKFKIGNIEIEIVTALEAQKKEAAVVKTWQEAIFNFLDKLKIMPKPSPMRAFSSTLSLEFVEGFQKNTKWLVGYGPRDFGPGHAEFPILEPGAPDTCFTIELTPSGLVAKTAHPEKVLLNGLSKKTEKIHDGLLIEIYNTQIKVHLTQKNTDEQANS